MEIIDLIGYAAGVFVVVSLLPQFIKSWKTKSTGDLSRSRYIIYLMGVSLWIVYGIVIGNGPMIVMNIIAFAIGASILFLKIKYG